MLIPYIPKKINYLNKFGYYLKNLYICKKITMIIHKILQPKIKLSSHQMSNYFSGSGYEDEELNFINDAPWMMYLSDEDLKTYYNRPDKNTRLSIKKQILQKLNK